MGAPLSAMCYLRTMRTLITGMLLAAQAPGIAQDWIQRADLVGGARWGASGFGIGTTGYICGGTNGSINSTELWAWDQATDAWSPRAAFPGPARREGVAFAIGAIGYYGFGRVDVGQPGMNDLWAYDPASDSWSELSPLPAVGRSAPSVFVLNGKAYLVGGNPQAMPYLSELWAYDPMTDTWTQHTSLPATGRSAPVAFAVNGKGYVGSGNDNSVNYACRDFWQWDPVADTWTQLGDMPGPERRTACYFPFDDRPIAGGGWDGTSYFTDYYTYHAGSDTWTAIPVFEGLGVHTPVSFNLNDRGYVGTGGIPGGSTDQFWEYDKGPLVNGVTSGSGAGALQVVVQGDALRLDGPASFAGMAYTIHDLQGRCVAAGTLLDAVVPVPMLGTGHYTLHLRDAGGATTAKGFVLVRP